jgi:nicotinamidase-related amidase
MSSRHTGNHNLNGNAPDQCKAALGIVDVITDLDFPRNTELVQQSTSLAKNIAGLKNQCRKTGIPVIYVNDNRGRWRSDSAAVVKWAMRRGSLGRAMVKRLLPRANDYVVLKPKHSPFYATPLDTLLEYLGVTTIILGGLTTESCVLLAATEAHIRDLGLVVPADCVAGLSLKTHNSALELLRSNFQADTRFWKALNLARLAGKRQ